MLGAGSGDEHDEGVRHVHAGFATVGGCRDDRRSGAVFRRRAGGGGRVFGSGGAVPAVLVQARFERHPRRPAFRFEHRFRIERIDMPETQDRNRLCAVGHAEQHAQRIDVEQRDPAHAEPFGAGREPHVLDRTGGGGEIHLRQRAAPEDMAFEITMELIYDYLLKILV